MKIYFMRHGFAYHNLGAKLYGDSAYNFPEYEDAKLTPEGVDHTIEIGKSLKNIVFNRIYSSPSLRCIETTTHFINQNVGFNIKNKIIALDDKLMEPQGKHVCNSRKDRLVLESIVPRCNKTFDFSNVSFNYDKNIVESDEKVDKRVIDFINNLKAECYQDDVILVVSHYLWLYKFFEIMTGVGYEFINSEVKIIELNK